MKPAVSERVLSAVMMLVGAAVSVNVKYGVCDEKTVNFFEFSLVVPFSCF